MEDNIKKLIDVMPKIIGNYKIRIVVELGARDGENTKILHDTYSESKVYSFECNPATIYIFVEKKSQV